MDERIRQVIVNYTQKLAERTQHHLGCAYLSFFVLPPYDGPYFALRGKTASTRQGFRPPFFAGTRTTWTLTSRLCRDCSASVSTTWVVSHVTMHKKLPFLDATLLGATLQALLDCIAFYIAV